MKFAVTAFPRALQGKGASRRLRASGRVPGVVYGADQAAQAVEFDHAALLRHIKLEAFHASILDLTIAGATTPALLRDFQMHPWKAQVVHVDFQRVDANKQIHMKVPLHFINADICAGVKVGGGVVQHIMNEIDINCLPRDLPEYIEVDLKDLELGHSMHVNDLKMPGGVEPIARVKHDNPSIVTVQVPKEVPVEEEAAAGAPVTEITGQKPEDAAAAGAASAGDGDKKEPAKKEAAPKKEADKK